MIRISGGAPAQPVLPKKTNPPSPRFGRDAIFERNNRFYSSNKTSDSAVPDRLFSPLRKALCTLLNRTQSPRRAEEVQELYTVQGRIRGEAMLADALTQAKTEFDTQNRAGHNKVDMGLAGIKLANAQLAADRDNEDAFDLLKTSFNLLEEADFKPTPSTAPPIYVHGLYNRACYTLNNSLYRATGNELGPEEMAYNDAIFEGMAVTLPNDYSSRQAFQKSLLDGLPYLKQAIDLAAGIPDDNVAQVEYLSAKGEMMHALSHLTPDRNVRKEFDQQGLEAFQTALQVLESVDTAKYTPQHHKLLEKISDIKIPHMCSHHHRPAKAQTLCAQLDNRGMNLHELMKNNQVHTVPDTPMEQLGKANESKSGKENKAPNPYEMLMQQVLFPEKTGLGSL